MNETKDTTKTVKSRIGCRLYKSQQTVEQGDTEDNARTMYMFLSTYVVQLTQLKAQLRCWVCAAFKLSRDTPSGAPLVSPLDACYRLLACRIVETNQRVLSSVSVSSVFT